MFSNELSNKDKQFVREVLRPKYPGYTFNEILQFYAANKDDIDYEYHLERKKQWEDFEKKQAIVNKRKLTIYNKRYDKAVKRWNNQLLNSRYNELEEHSDNHLNHNLTKYLDKKYMASEAGMNLINHFRNHTRMKEEYDELKIAHLDLNKKYEELLNTRPDQNRVNRMTHAISDSKQRHVEKRKKLYDELKKEFYDFKVKLDKPIYEFIKKLLSIILHG